MMLVRTGVKSTRGWGPAPSGAARQRPLKTRRQHHHERLAPGPCLMHSQTPAHVPATSRTPCAARQWGDTHHIWNPSSSSSTMLQNGGRSRRRAPPPARSPLLFVVDERQQVGAQLLIHAALQQAQRADRMMRRRRGRAAGGLGSRSRLGPTGVPQATSPPLQSGDPLSTEHAPCHPPFRTSAR